MENQNYCMSINKTFAQIKKGWTTEKEEKKVKGSLPGTHSAPGYRKNENNWSEIFIIKCSDKRNTDGFQNTMLLVQGTVSSYKRVLLYLVHANKRPLEPKTI